MPSLAVQLLRAFGVVPTSEELELVPVSLRQRELPDELSRRVAAIELLKWAEKALGRTYGDLNFE
jgi:hypothetical protein